MWRFFRGVHPPISSEKLPAKLGGFGMTHTIDALAAVPVPTLTKLGR
jgi:hypothetical protein